jgi:uncharacterized protein YkwD
MAVDPKCFTTDFIGEGAEQCILTDEKGILDSTVTCGKSTIIPKDKIGSCPDAQAALDAHNEARSRYGANPLLWSKTLAQYAQQVVDTCVFQHSNGQYGENLAIGTRLSCEQAVDLWVDEEGAYPPGGVPGFSQATGHFSQVVWKDTLQVGCAFKRCPNGNFVACSYNPPGNYIGQFAEQVGSPGEKPDCYPPESGKSPPVPAPKPNPAPVPNPAPQPPPAPSPPAQQCCFFRICSPIFCRN